MPERFDVVVVGGGPAGENVVGRCAAGGLSVALVEHELVGGECSYWGCVPSKTLVRPGDVLAAARRVPGAREAVTGRIDVAAALARRDEMTGGWDDTGQQAWLKSVGATLVRGHGRLAGERTVDVATPEGMRRLVAARAVVLATGTGPVIPPIDGLVDVAPWDNRDATGTRAVPARLLVLGGGAIGTELAQAFWRLGSLEVTVIEAAERLLPREEPFASEQVRTAFEAEGIRVVIGTLATAARRDGAHGPVTVSLADGGDVVGDEVLVAVGRRPATGDLGLDTVGLAPGRPVAVDDQMRAVTGEPASPVGAPNGWLYAVGDCNGRALFTHMGKYQGRIAGDHIRGRSVAATADRTAIPRVTFTDPQVAAVGLTEAEAVAAGIDVRVVTTPTGGVAGAYTQGEGIEGTSALVVDLGRDVIVGATFTGPAVADLLHSATVAIVGQVPLQDLWHAVPSFPTVSEVWLRLLEAHGL